VPSQHVSDLAECVVDLVLVVAARYEIEAVRIKLGVADWPPVSGEGREDPLEEVVHFRTVIPAAEPTGLEGPPQLVDVLCLGRQRWSSRLVGTAAGPARTAGSWAGCRAWLTARAAETTRHRRPSGQTTGRAEVSAVAPTGPRTTVARVRGRWGLQAHLGRTVGVNAPIRRAISGRPRPTLLRTRTIRPWLIRPWLIWAGPRVLRTRSTLLRTRTIRPCLIRPWLIRPWLIRPWLIRPWLIWAGPIPWLVWAATEIRRRTTEAGVAVTRRRVCAGRRTV
jgi:hypothetical protein